jgi:hypothetical protein
MELKLVKEFGKAFIPETIFNHPIRASLRRYLSTAGFRDIPYELFGVLFFATAFITYLIYVPFIFPLLTGMNPLMVFIMAFISWAGIQGTLITLIILIIILVLA